MALCEGLLLFVVDPQIEVSEFVGADEILLSWVNSGHNLFLFVHHIICLRSVFSPQKGEGPVR